MTRQNRRDRWAGAVVRAKLPASTRLFLSTVLVKHMKANGQVCHPRELLADELGISERTVTRHITRAKESGWLMPETISGGFRGVVATYEASFPSERMGDTSVTLSTVPKRDRISTHMRDSFVPQSRGMRDTWCPTKKVLTYLREPEAHIVEHPTAQDRDDDAWRSYADSDSRDRRSAPSLADLIRDEISSSSKVSRHLRAVPA